MTSPAPDMLAAALRYVTKLGVPVFPLAPGGKIPLYRNPHPKGTDERDGPARCRGRADGCELDGHGWLDATLDAAIVERWWTRTPNANIGVATGWCAATGSGFDVVDFDIKPGRHGRLAHSLLVGRRLGRSDLLDRLWQPARTASGGLHLWYPATPVPPQSNHTQAHWGVDMRGTGGYVAAPPSVVGAAYRWLRTTEVHHAGTDVHGRAYEAFSGQRVTHWWYAHPGDCLAPAPIEWGHLLDRMSAYRCTDGRIEAVAAPPPRPETHAGGSGMGARSSAGALGGAPQGGPQTLAAWMAAQPEGNRNSGLYWATRRGCEDGFGEADFDVIEQAALTAGLGAGETRATMRSARAGR